MRGPPARHPDEQREQLPAVEGTIADAAELKPGDRVVYPNQGVCAVVGVEEKDIAGQKLQLVRMRREEDGAAVLVPQNKVPSIGLRRVATGEQMEGVFHYLAAQFDDPELDWKVRHRDNADRLIAGGVLGVAEVVKGLHSLSRIRPLPTKEREQYDNARHLLVHEIAVSLGVPPVLAEDYVDYALMPPAGVKFDAEAAAHAGAAPVAAEEAPAGRRRGGRSRPADLGLDIDLAGRARGRRAARPRSRRRGASRARRPSGEAEPRGGRRRRTAKARRGGAPAARRRPARPRRAAGEARPAAKAKAKAGEGRAKKEKAAREEGGAPAKKPAGEEARRAKKAGREGRAAKRGGKKK